MDLWEGRTYLRVIIIIIMILPLIQINILLYFLSHSSCEGGNAGWYYSPQFKEESEVKKLKYIYYF